MNLFAVVLAALAAFIIGFMWHGPLFGKTWMRLANITPTGNEKFADMIPKMLWNMLVNLVTAFVFAGALWIADSSSVIGGLTWYKGSICGIWLWLGFLVTTTSIDVIWMGRSLKLWLFEASASFTVMVVMGAIIASMM